MRARPGFQKTSRLDANVVSLPRALSKLGICSRSRAEALIQERKVRVNGRIITQINQRVHMRRDKITVDHEEVSAPRPVYLMLNKPRGLVTTVSDEQGRQTVYECLQRANLPRIVPVGRLDQASEGLLLFTNDTKWADTITSPHTHLPKVYHVQVNPIPSPEQLAKCIDGVEVEDGEILKCSEIKLLRTGERNGWIVVTLHEGKNRHIRRVLKAIGIDVLRLIRVAIGPLQLGNLAKGEHRLLTPQETDLLATRTLA